MEKSAQKVSFDFKDWSRNAALQFKNLDAKNPYSWPFLPRLALCAAIAVAIAVALWFLWLTHVNNELIAAQAEEVTLRADYSAKLVKVIGLEKLEQQLVQVREHVAELEKQLPGKAEMDDLLSSINQAGIGRSLQFDLFRPGTLAVHEYHVQQPIDLKVTGRYHDFGGFAADVAHLPRIVTINQIAITPGRDGNLTIDAVVNTFRYLDKNEIEKQQAAAGGANK